MKPDHPPRLLMLQFGDYRQAILDKENGKPETYRAQHYSMDCINEIVGRGEALIVCLDCEPYEYRSKNLTIIGGRFMPGSRGLGHLLDVLKIASRLIVSAEDFKPTHVIIRTPGWVMKTFGRWALGRNIPVLPIFADFFYSGGLRNRLKNYPLARILNDSRIKIVANHNIPASQSMVDCNVNPDKIVPYDWPQIRSPHDLPPKGSPSGEAIRLFYAGQVSAPKGVFTILDALSILGKKRVRFKLDVCGLGPDLEAFISRTRSLGLESAVNCRGLTPNETVFQLMREADFTLVPSLHAYPEGLPCVIYESFEARTPVICSDHPSFLLKLKDNLGARFFPASDAQALASLVTDSIREPVYAGLSASTLQAWEEIQCPVDFRSLLRDWMNWTSDGTEPACLRHALGKQEK